MVSLQQPFSNPAIYIIRSIYISFRFITVIYCFIIIVVVVVMVRASCTAYLPKTTSDSVSVMLSDAQLNAPFELHLISFSLHAAHASCYPIFYTQIYIYIYKVPSLYTCLQAFCSACSIWAEVEYYYYYFCGSSLKLLHSGLEQFIVFETPQKSFETNAMNAVQPYKKKNNRNVSTSISAKLSVKGATDFYVSHAFLNGLT
eukprot:gene2076-1257_t